MNRKALADLLDHAAEIIDGEALCLRMSHTTAPDHDDWGGEEDALATYEEWKATVGKLYDAAEELRRRKR